MDVPYNTDEPVIQRNPREIRELARRLRDSGADRIVRPRRGLAETPKKSFRPWVKKVICALSIPVFLIMAYYGFKILLLVLIALENRF
jgi:hypothetical protein